MIAIATEDDLRTLYGNFNTGTIDAILAVFSPDARYHQAESNAIGRTPSEIGCIIGDWLCSFENASLAITDMTHDTPAAPEVSGAADCWHIDYQVTGVFAKLIPGLDISPTGHEVVVAMTDSMWVDPEGRILRLENSMNIPALRG